MKDKTRKQESMMTSRRINVERVAVIVIVVIGAIRCHSNSTGHRRYYASVLRDVMPLRCCFFHGSWLAGVFRIADIIADCCK